MVLFIASTMLLGGIDHPRRGVGLEKIDVLSDNGNSQFRYERDGPRPYNILGQVKRLADFRSQ